MARTTVAWAVAVCLALAILLPLVGTAVKHVRDRAFPQSKVLTERAA